MQVLVGAQLRQSHDALALLPAQAGIQPLPLDSRHKRVYARPWPIEDGRERP
jgi:hypothetical protein